MEWKGRHSETLRGKDRKQVLMEKTAVLAVMGTLVGQTSRWVSYLWIVGRVLESCFATGAKDYFGARCAATSPFT